MVSSFHSRDLSLYSHSCNDVYEWTIHLTPSPAERSKTGILSGNTIVPLVDGLPPFSLPSTAQFGKLHVDVTLLAQRRCCWRQWESSVYRRACSVRRDLRRCRRRCCCCCRFAMLLSLLLLLAVSSARTPLTARLRSKLERGLPEGTNMESDFSARRGSLTLTGDLWSPKEKKRLHGTCRSQRLMHGIWHF